MLVIAPAYLEEPGFLGIVSGSDVLQQSSGHQSCINHAHHMGAGVPVRRPHGDELPQFNAVAHLHSRFLKKLPGRRFIHGLPACLQEAPGDGPAILVGMSPPLDEQDVQLIVLVHGENHHICRH